MGWGAAHQGDVETAREAEGRLARLGAGARRAGEDLFARNIRILELSTPKHAVTPGPTLPAYELLGDLLREQARPAEALATYRSSLELYPGRFNSLLGAARAAREAGDDVLARDYYRRLLEIAGNGTRRDPLTEARELAVEASVGR